MNNQESSEKKEFEPIHIEQSFNSYQEFEQFKNQMEYNCPKCTYSATIYTHSSDILCENINKEKHDDKYVY